MPSDWQPSRRMRGHLRRCAAAACEMARPEEPAEHMTSFSMRNNDSLPVQKMQRRVMLTEDLNLFASVSQLGTFSGAARIARTTPSTVSRRIAALEDEVGVKLFNR